MWARFVKLFQSIQHVVPPQWIGCTRTDKFALTKKMIPTFAGVLFHNRATKSGWAWKNWHSIQMNDSRPVVVHCVDGARFGLAISPRPYFQGHVQCIWAASSQIPIWEKVHRNAVSPNSLMFDKVDREIRNGVIYKLTLASNCVRPSRVQTWTVSRARGFWKKKSEIENCAW